MESREKRGHCVRNALLMDKLLDPAVSSKGG